MFCSLSCLSSIDFAFTISLNLCYITTEEIFAVKFWKEKMYNKGHEWKSRKISYYCFICMEDSVWFEWNDRFERNSFTSTFALNLHQLTDDILFSLISLSTLRLHDVLSFVLSSLSIFRSKSRWICPFFVSRMLFIVFDLFVLSLTILEKLVLYARLSKRNKWCICIIIASKISFSSFLSIFMKYERHNVHFLLSFMQSFSLLEFLPLLPKKRSIANDTNERGKNLSILNHPLICLFRSSSSFPHVIHSMYSL